MKTIVIYVVAIELIALPAIPIKIFYDRSTNSAAFCALQSMSLPFFATQIINTFPTSRILAHHDKGLGFWQSGYPYTL